MYIKIYIVSSANSLNNILKESEINPGSKQKIVQIIFKNNIKMMKKKGTAEKRCIEYSLQKAN